MIRTIRKVAVLGSGTMGSGIAAHLANVGIRCFLLDIVPSELLEQEKSLGLTLDSQEVRNRIATNNKQQFILKNKLPLIMDKDDADLITVGNFEDNLDWLSECDWVIEIVLEKLDIKQKLLEKIEPYIKTGTIITSNTSGIFINKIGEVLPMEKRKYWLGTHFFNPVRYMKLLEIIPAKDTLPEIVQFMAKFGEKVLGKGIVHCNDTPNFIANRLGAMICPSVFRPMLKYGLTVSEVDALVGTQIGRPPTATFALCDLVGVDIALISAQTVRDNVSDPKEKVMFQNPPVMQEIVNKGYLGNKTKGGFYTKQGKEKFMLDLNSLEYVSIKEANFESLKNAQEQKTLAGKLEAFFEHDDAAAKLVWEHIKEFFLHAAFLIPEISDNILNIDRAMSWGYNMAGPFESWSGLDLEKYINRMEQEGEEIPQWIKEMLGAGVKTFYKTESGIDYYYSIPDKKYLPIKFSPGIIVLKDLKSQNKVIRSTSETNLYDLGDGVICLEIANKNSIFSIPVMEDMMAAREELEKNWEGMVLASSGTNFCIGSDLKGLFPFIESKNWDEIDRLTNEAQQLAMANKYSLKPVVAAVRGRALGGGCEIAIQTSAIQAAAETYMGLVEVGVGLIPGGGGVKEMTMRAMERTKGTSAFALDFIIPYFQNITMTKISASAKDAIKLGYLKSTDGITMGNEWVITDAKKKILEMVEKGYSAPVSRPFPALGLNDSALPLLMAQTMLNTGAISEYDYYLFSKVLYIMAGGNITRGTMINEQYLLDVEREVFVSLCGEPKTQERMKYMLTKGKLLRN